MASMYVAVRMDAEDLEVNVLAVSDDLTVLVALVEQDIRQMEAEDSLDADELPLDEDAFPVQAFGGLMAWDIQIAEVK